MSYPFFIAFMAKNIATNYGVRLQIGNNSCSNGIAALENRDLVLSFSILLLRIHIEGELFFDVLTQA